MLMNFFSSVQKRPDEVIPPQIEDPPHESSFHRRDSFPPLYAGCRHCLDRPLLELYAVLPPRRDVASMSAFPRASRSLAGDEGVLSKKMISLLSPLRVSCSWRPSCFLTDGPHQMKSFLFKPWVGQPLPIAPTFLARTPEENPPFKNFRDISPFPRRYHSRPSGLPSLDVLGFRGFSFEIGAAGFPVVLALGVVMHSTMQLNNTPGNPSSLEVTFHSSFVFLCFIARWYPERRKDPSL